MFRIGGVSFISGIIKIMFPLFIGLKYGSVILGQYSFLYHSVLVSAIPIESGLGFAILRYAKEMDQRAVYSISVLLLGVYIVVIGVPIAFFLPVPVSYFIMGFIFYSLQVVNRYALWGSRKYNQALIFEFISLLFVLVLLTFLDQVTDGYQLMIAPIAYGCVHFCLSLRFSIQNFSISATCRNSMKKIFRFSTFLLIANGLGFGVMYLQYPMISVLFNFSIAGTLTFLNLIFSPLQLVSYPLVVFFLSGSAEEHSILNTIIGRLDLITLISVFLYFFAKSDILLILTAVDTVQEFLDIQIFSILLFANLIMISNSIKSIHFMKDEKLESVIPISSVFGFFLTICCWFIIPFVSNPYLIPFGFLLNLVTINLIFTFSRGKTHHQQWVSWLMNVLTLILGLTFI